MGAKKKYMWWIIIIAALILLCASLSILGIVNSNTYMEQPTIPRNTGVLIHYVGPYDRDYGAVLPQSYFNYYDNSGTLLGTYMEPEIAGGSCIAKGSDKIVYFFMNHTISADYNTSTTLDVSDSITLSGTDLHPSEVGYIEELELAYALLNVGMLPGSDEYINIIRFVSEEESYDVVVPYYLLDISYDVSARKIIGLVSPLTTNVDTESNKIQYVTIEYDVASGVFKATDGLQEMSLTGVYKGTKLFQYILAKDNKLYIVYNTLQTTSNMGCLYLDVFDVNEESHLCHKVLLENYDAGRFGHGVMTGVSTSPVIENNNKLYIFLSDNQIVEISDESNIQFKEMPFAFENALNKFDLSSTDSRVDYFGSLVGIGNNGDVYILNVYPNEILRIHKLKEDGTYLLFWEGTIPNLMLPGSEVVSFVIFD